LVGHVQRLIYQVCHSRNVYKYHTNQGRHTKVDSMFEEIRPEMRALMYFMVGMTLLAIGLLLGQTAFSIDFLTMP